MSQTSLILKPTKPRVSVGLYILFGVWRMAKPWHESGKVCLGRLSFKRTPRRYFNQFREVLDLVVRYFLVVVCCVSIVVSCYVRKFLNFVFLILFV